MNRPFGAVDVSANLKGAVPKTATQKILVALAEKGEVVQKTYGEFLHRSFGTNAGCMRGVRAGWAGSQYMRTSRPCVLARAGEVWLCKDANHSQYLAVGLKRIYTLRAPVVSDHITHISA